MRQCEAWANARSAVSARFSHSYRCPNPAKFRVQAAQAGQVVWEGEYVCGRHVRPALMDNGDSVRKPWIVSRLDA
jgi:hypothetical protein